MTLRNCSGDADMDAQWLFGQLIRDYPAYLAIDLYKVAVKRADIYPM